MKNENEVAAKHLFTSMAMTVIQQDIKIINNSNIKIKEIYISQLESMHSLASEECRLLKQTMFNKRIKVIPIGKTNASTEYKFIVNDREEMKLYNNHIIKRNVKEILQDLMKSI